MRKVTFFIPHYSDHERLKFQLSLAEQIYNFPRNYVIYDSSPLQRWEDAIDKIKYIEENKEIFEKLCVSPLGRVGAQIGN